MRTLKNSSGVEFHEIQSYLYGANNRFAIRRFADHEGNVVWALYDAEAGSVWPAPMVEVFASEEEAKKAAEKADASNQ